MKTILKYFMMENEKTLTFIVWFTESFSVHDFEGLERLVYLFLEYCSRLGIIAKRKYLDAFLRTDGKSLVYEHGIKLDSMGPLDYNDPSALEEAYRLIAAAMFAYCDEVEKHDLQDSTFKVDVDSWMNVQKKQLLTKTVSNNFPRIQSGDTADDIIIDLQAELERIADTFDRTKLNDLDFIRTAESSDKKASTLIGKTHIPAIDSTLRGIHERDIVTYTGLTGSGKTRLMMRVVYNIAVLEKKSVRVDSLEMDKDQIENMLIAMHIVTLFRGDVKIPDSLMNDNELDDVQLQYYNAAKEDLFNNKNYGTIYIYDGELYVDLMYKKAIAWLRLNKDVKFWAIDYAGTCRWSVTSKQFVIKADIIDKLYDTVRSIGKATRCAFWINNQYNKEGAEKARAGKRIDQGDIQGGQTVHKYSTFNIYSTQTPEQQAVSMLMMTNDKGRFAKRFTNVPFDADLAISMFRQKQKEITN